MRSVASPNETPGARLKETVTEGNNPVWFTASGVVPGWAVVTVTNGTFPFCGTFPLLDELPLDVLPLLELLLLEELPPEPPALLAAPVLRK